MSSTLHSCLQASMPSNHLCSTFPFPDPPHFLYQAPLGAQQLNRPDFSNVPHFGHVIVLMIVVVIDGVLAGVLVMMSSRSLFSVTGPRKKKIRCSGFGRRDTCRRSVAFAESHPVCDIPPGDPSNILSCLALDRTQASPQSVLVNDFASKNIEDMSFTLDTSHLEMSPL